MNLRAKNVFACKDFCLNGCHTRLPPKKPWVTFLEPKHMDMSLYFWPYKKSKKKTQVSSKGKT